LKLLLYDIETFPHKASVWGKFDQNVIKFEEYGSIASVAFQWLGKSKIYMLSRRQFKDKTPKSLLKAFYHVLQSANYTLAHNGDSFDKKMLNAYFAQWEFPPPKPTVDLDTKKLAKKYFRFPGNSLNDLGDFLGIGKKMPHTGFDMWDGCRKGDPKSWALMEKYNKHDVWLLGEVYKRLRPWIFNQPGISIASSQFACSNCAGFNMVMYGTRMQKNGKKQVWRCQDCGGIKQTSL
jgi:hypothetical protein